MADYTYASSLVLSELLRISKNIVWKNPKFATQGEATVDGIAVEQYNLARQGRLTFDMIYAFDEEPLRGAGIPEEDISSYMDDPTIVPEQYRDVLTSLQQQYTISHYVEQNNYYRMLSGLPDIEDEDFIYNIKYPSISNTVTPIHELSQEQLNRLDAVGYLTELIEKYPSKKYLQHLTEKRIDVYIARNSEDYALLYLPPSDLIELRNQFREQYEKSRTMVSMIYKVKNLAAENTEYHGFIGLVILFATINMMQQKFLEADITRDFFDDESLRLVYDSYCVPFYEKIPIEYHRKIVKNINRLISMKGSTKCIYELFDIFGFSNIDIYEFYMIKLHRFENGKPVFIKDKDGKYDLRRMYDVKFAKARLYDNPQKEISNHRNHLTYDEMTASDPYWISDKKLLDTIYSSQYNYVDSKYLGIQTTFNLMKILYEGSFYLKMILDNRKLLSFTSMYYKNLRTECNLFDFIIYACCIMTRKNDMSGNIVGKPHEIGKFLGFNFKQDLTIVKENISKNDYLKNDAPLINLLTMVDVNSLENVMRVYDKIVDLRKYLTNKMHETHDANVYNAYYELYNMLMYSEYADDVFQKSDGTRANSFEELLQDINPALYNRYMNTDSYDENTEVADVLYTLQNTCSSLHQIVFSDDLTSNALFEYLFKLIDFFKSAKADLTGYEIILSLAHNSENTMKLLSYIDTITDSSAPIATIFDELKDMIVYYETTERLRDDFIYFEDGIVSIDKKELLMAGALQLDSRLRVVSDIILRLTSTMSFSEELFERSKCILPPDSFVMKDQVALLHDEVIEILIFYIQDNFGLGDTVRHIAEYSCMNSDFVSETNLKTLGKSYEDRESHRLRLQSKLVMVLLGDERIQDDIMHIKDSLHRIGDSNKSIDNMRFLTKLRDLIEQKRLPDTLLFGEDTREFLNMKFSRTAEIILTDSYMENYQINNIDSHRENIMKFFDCIIEGIHIFRDEEPLIFDETITCIKEQSFESSKIGPLVDGIKSIDDLEAEGKLSKVAFQDVVTLVYEKKHEEV